MGKAPKGPKHPAKKFFTIAAALMAIAAILSFITLFVPWSMKMPNSTAHYSYAVPPFAHSVLPAADQARCTTPFADQARCTTPFFAKVPSVVELLLEPSVHY